MTKINTLRSIAGLQDANVDWDDAVLVYIDFQNEYCEGVLKLGPNGTAALDKAKKLLDVARNQKIPVFHVLHKSSATSPVFNCESHLSDVVSHLEPTEDEQVVHKTMPNSFFNTNLEELLQLTGRKQLIIAGFMSHMCVNATTIRAVELGYNVIICEDACASRSLSENEGEVIDGVMIHKAAMASLADRYATVLKLTDFT